MKTAFDVKSSRMDVFAIHLHTADLTELEEFLRQRAGQYREFQVMPFVLDVQDFDHPESFDLGSVISVFARYGMQILGLRHPSETWAATASRYHLVFSLGESAPAESRTAIEETQFAPSSAGTSNPTVIVNTPIRTGQQVYAENADLIVTGMVNHGAEIIADGNIHVYAPMRGRALAGASGNRSARIFIYSMQAELVSVAGIYRNFEHELPEHLHKKTVQILLQDDRLVITPIDGN